MSSFQRFQRDSRIRNSRNSSQKSSKLSSSAKKNALNPNTDNFLHQESQPLNLIIYPKQITFTFIPGANESIPFVISLTNSSIHRLYFKIRTSNSNGSYEISPFEEVIQRGGTMNVSFILTHKNQPLQRFLEDRFQIQWGMIPERPNQKIELLHSQILRVKVSNNRQQANRFTLGKQPQRVNTLSKLKKSYNSFEKDNGFNGVSQRLFQGFRSEAEKDVQYQNRNSGNFDDPLNSNPYALRSQIKDKFTGDLNGQQQEQIYKEWENYNEKNIQQQQKKLQAELIQMAIRGTIGLDQKLLNSGVKKLAGLNRNKKYQTLLTRTNIIIVAAVSFFIGLISA